MTNRSHFSHDEVPISNLTLSPYSPFQSTQGRIVKKQGQLSMQLCTEVDYVKFDVHWRFTNR